MLRFTSKLTDYKVRVEIETGKEVKITISSGLGLGMWASYRYVPEYIDIYLDFNPNRKINPEDIEHSLAHEMTHGWLNHKMKYLYLKEKRGLTNKENIIVNTMGTMIEDIVVNKLLQDNNFMPYSSVYIPQLKKEISTMDKHMIAYSKSARPEFADEEIRDRFMVQRYICVFGSWKYLKVNNLTRLVFRDYLRAFKSTYKKQYKEAQPIEKLITEQDLFTREGHYIVFDQCIKMWNLTDIVEILFPD